MLVNLKNKILLIFYLKNYELLFSIMCDIG
jgi:hypothetical protein